MSRRSQQIVPTRGRPVSPGEWVTIPQAASLTGDSAGVWRRRALRAVEAAYALKQKPRVVRAPAKIRDSKLVWYLHRSLDRRFEVSFDEFKRRDMSWVSGYPDKAIDRARRREHWLLEWRRACDLRNGRKPTVHALTAALIKRAKRGRHTDFRISLRTLEIWWRMYTHPLSNGHITGLEGLIESRFRKQC